MTHPQPRIDNPRSARAATQTRMVRQARSRYSPVARVTGALAIVTIMLLGYVMLTSNLTSLTYATAKAHAQRAALLEENSRLEDRIATLESDQRLAAIAAKLGMREPERFTVVRLDRPPNTARPRTALLSTLAEWLVSARHPASGP